MDVRIRALGRDDPAMAGSMPETWLMPNGRGDTAYRPCALALCRRASAG